MQPELLEMSCTPYVTSLELSIKEDTADGVGHVLINVDSIKDDDDLAAFTIPNGQCYCVDPVSWLVSRRFTVSGWASLPK